MEENQLSVAEQLKEKMYDLIFKVALGAVVLSITFKDLLTGEEVIAQSLLNHVWITFGVTILTRVFMFIPDAKASNQIKIIRFPFKLYHSTPQSVFRAILYTSFLYGVIVFIVFAVLNN